MNHTSEYQTAINWCKWCGAECKWLTGELCTNCWEVSHRMDDFLAFDNNRVWMQAQLDKAELDA